MGFDGIGLIAAISAVLFAVSVHEAAHGWAAERFGDPTARELGRITLNPLKHIDPFLSVILPGILFLIGAPVLGGAKPVPFDPRRMRPGTNIKKAIMWVAAAGPISNFILAFLSVYLFTFLRSSFGFEFGESVIGKFLSISFIINVVLGVFNLLPLPPLDGAKVLAGFLPTNLAVRLYMLERYAIIFIIILIVSPLSQVIFWPIQVVAGGMEAFARVLVW